MTVSKKLPFQCNLLIADIDAVDGSLCPEEETAAAKMADRRRREFTAGRVLARRALEPYNQGKASLPVSGGRYPCWPDGITGSISHSGDKVGVVAASTTEVAGVGFDLEATESLKTHLHDRVLTDRERQQLLDRPCDDVTFIFAAKEAVYKAANPLFDEFIDFQDVSVSWSEGRFLASCETPCASAETINAGNGLFWQHDDFFHAVFWLQGVN